MKSSLNDSVSSDELQFVLLVRSCERIGFELHVPEVEARHLIEARALQQAVAIARVDSKAVKACRFGVGVKRNLIGLMQTELLDLHGDPSGTGFLQRDFDFQFFGLRTFPLHGLNLA